MVWPDFFNFASNSRFFGRGDAYENSDRITKETIGNPEGMLLGLGPDFKGFGWFSLEKMFLKLLTSMSTHNFA